MKKVFFVLILFVFFLASLNSIYGAKVYGNVYGPGLELLKGSIVEINSTPKQVIVADNGDYSFNVDVGNYTLSARYYYKGNIFYTKENISIVKDGEYAIDLLLFDVMDIDFGFNDTGINEVGGLVGETNKNLIFIVIGVVVVLVVVYLFLRKKWKKKEKKVVYEVEDEIKNKIFNIIKRERRITQKEIRQKVGMSEAKVSLVISELEDEGKIKKIKKGRGNIIIYKGG